MREALTRREADMELTQLAAALPTDAMPGEADPATYALPQQPMHRRASRLMLQQRNRLAQCCVPCPRDRCVLKHSPGQWRHCSNLTHGSSQRRNFRQEAIPRLSHNI